ncbi:DUF3349 domain-containing protein [Williamsia sp. CHRR-6]|uniref:DUF3349 domain-containing protein n=1 Tax=Williamsia sp. CHRR-6 TaxID=2835871 RepID=UPI001BD9FBBF|nr:DUF3349 domain-containing protein [Williamsia sp. CHRR-6]MBT0565942.1 DUF3349 domain-containing protein [Williamsia sp. CHRR-6]
MDRPTMLRSIITWLRAGDPHGGLRGYHIPLLPLLPLLGRRLTDDEVRDVAATVIDQTEQPPTSRVDIAVQISQITEKMPSQEDTERVHSVLAAAGWDLDEPGPPGGASS